MSIEAGLRGSASIVVTAADTATALGSGDVDVLGTPRLVALCEEATVAAVARHLPEGRTTVGTRIELDHLRASRVGATVTASAELREVDGRRLVFDVIAVEGADVVGRGVVVRALVERERFSS